MATPISIEIKKSSNTCYFVGETSNVKVRSINVTYDDGSDYYKATHYSYYRKVV